MSYVARAIEYAEQVIAREVVAGKWTVAACQRFLDDLAAPGEWHMDESLADRACWFCEQLHHFQGRWANQPLLLSPWQVFVTVNIFGWVGEDGARRFRKAYVEVARKNGKSTWCAALALLLLVGDGEAAAQVYTAATTQAQARVVWDAAWKIARATPELIAELGLKLRAAEKKIVIEDGSFLHPFAGDGQKLDGFSPSAAVIDELHAHRNADVWNVITSGTGARRQPLMIAITTAGERMDGICYDQHRYVRAILTRTLQAHDGLGYTVAGNPLTDERYFGVIYAIDDDDSYDDESCWPKANPNLGIAPSLESLRSELQQARIIPSQRTNFLIKHMCRWQSSGSPWKDMGAWDRCAVENFDALDSSDWDLFCGIDLASKHDLSAVAWLWRRGSGPEARYRLRVRGFLPEAAVVENTSVYQPWVDDGHVTATADNVLDKTAVERDCMDAAAAGCIEFGVDPGHGYQFCARMSQEGLPFVEVRNTVLHMSEPAKELHALVRSGRLEHDGNPALRWCVGNVIAKPRPGELIMPERGAAKDKIDMAIAAI